MFRTILATLIALSFAFAAQADDSGSDDGKKKCPKKEAFLAKHDADGDGKLSETERKAFHEARRAAVLAKHDADGDGELSEDERKAARAAFAKEHPRKARGMKRGGPDGKKCRKGKCDKDKESDSGSAA